MREYKTQMEAARRGIITPEMKKDCSKRVPHRGRNQRACCKRPGGYLRQQTSHLH